MASSDRTVATLAPVGMARAFEAHVAAGPDRGATIALEPGRPGPALVGQGPVCDLRLSDREVSRRHLSLEVDASGLVLIDLRSTNGTRVNGVRVREAILAGGERIDLGATAIEIRARGRHELALPTTTSFGRVVGSSPEMRRLYPLLARLAEASVPVVVEGETGTGKERVAEALHEEGPRKQGPFVVFDCTAVPPNLLESALFGHERGAFTGAIAAKKGVFELADGGTLFLDEIGDLDVALQAKLLRALERSEVCRVGGSTWKRVDVRIVAATRRDLDREVQAGRFRDDLFFRLAVARVELPPLRRRAGDIAVLARHFWRELGGQNQPLPLALFQRYEDYPWPGNVRELRNAVARRIALGDLALPPGAGTNAEAPPPAPAGADLVASILAEELPLVRARERVVEAFERRYVERVLAKHGGNVTAAAAASGIARRYFYVLRAKHERG